MSNYVEYNDKIAFHPGYYVKEIVDESGLTQADFAKRLGTTPKNLSILLRGEQSLSIDIAMKLSRMIGTSVNYWLNLQSAYDTLVAEFRSEQELAEERIVFSDLDYKYFRDNFDLPNLPRKIDEQIRQVREFLQVATLTVFRNRDMAVSFKSASEDISVSNTIKANIMVQIAINKALTIKAPKFDKGKFEKATEYALLQTKNHKEFYPLIRKKFLEAGVIFIILPNLSGSKISGATKKIGDNIMLMVNDRRLYSDTFWFTLFHEIGHIINGDFGISFESESGVKEAAANKYAEDMLIPRERYEKFLNNKEFTLSSVRSFAEEIDRDPGIVLGRLQNDGLLEYNDWKFQVLKHKYKVITSA